MASEVFSVEQVAARLGLHVRTVRNYVRSGRLKAVRIGKQYRIARADLEAFTGQGVPPTARETAGRQRRTEATTVVEIDAIDRATADRLSTMLLAVLNGGAGVRLQTVYDEERAGMKVIILGDVGSTAELLRLVGVVTGDET